MRNIRRALPGYLIGSPASSGSSALPQVGALILQSRQHATLAIFAS